MDLRLQGVLVKGELPALEACPICSQKPKCDYLLNPPAFTKPAFKMGCKCDRAVFSSMIDAVKWWRIKCIFQRP